MRSKDLFNQIAGCVGLLIILLGLGIVVNFWAFLIGIGFSIITLGLTAFAYFYNEAKQIEKEAQVEARKKQGANIWS